MEMSRLFLFLFYLKKYPCVVALEGGLWMGCNTIGVNSKPLTRDFGKLTHNHTSVSFLNVPLVLRSFFLIKCFSKVLLSSISGAQHLRCTLSSKVYLTVFNGCPV